MRCTIQVNFCFLERKLNLTSFRIAKSLKFDVDPLFLRYPYRQIDRLQNEKRDAHLALEGTKVLLEQQKAETQSWKDKLVDYKKELQEHYYTMEKVQNNAFVNIISLVSLLLIVCFYFYFKGLQ